MPAVMEVDGREVYYVPPPPPPPLPGTNAQQFHQAMVVATHATTAYDSGDGSAAAENTAWTNVESVIENQYRLAASISDPNERARQIAWLDSDFAGYFQGHLATGIYQGVYKTARAEVLGGRTPTGEVFKPETPSQIKAGIQLYDAGNDPASPQSQEIGTGCVVGMLQQLYPKVSNGVYTAAQINAAVAALDQLDPMATQLFSDGATDLEQGQAFSAVLAAVQAKVLKLTPAEIKSVQSEFPGFAKLTTSGTLILTPAEAKLAVIDPVTLAFLEAAGITVTTLPPQMANLAKENPVLFEFMEINGCNISVQPASAKPKIDPATGEPYPSFSLGHGKVLDITVNGKPISYADLPKGMTPDKVAALYNGGAGTVDLATMLLPQLPVNLATLSSQNVSPAIAQLGLLLADADSARPQYANAALSALLKAAPPPTSKNAAGYIANTINPFLATQLNGFFDQADASAFWATSPAVSTLKNYLQTGLAAQVQPGNMNVLNAVGDYLGQVLSGASPEEAKMLIGLVEGQINALKPSQQELFSSSFLDALSQAVQLVDGLPLGQLPPGTQPGAEANQVATWLLNTAQRGLPVLGNWATLADQFYYDITSTGNTDLPEALRNAWHGSAGKYIYGTNGSSPIEIGPAINDIATDEGDYESAHQNQLGLQYYNAFENNKTEVLKQFYAQYANSPDIGVPISVSNTPALTKAVTTTVTNTYSGDPNVTPQQIKQIITIDLAWIKSQSGPGAMATILPFLFAASTIGTQDGVFFDITNPQPKDRPLDPRVTSKADLELGPQLSPPQYPPQVLIDGSAALAALEQDPDAYQHPDSVDVTWHYQNYRDFQLSNDMYPGGTIYTLLNNPLGIGPSGAASSGTDFHKGFDTVMDDAAGGAAVVGGIALLPWTGGASAFLTVAGLSLTAGSLLWSTYSAINQYQSYTSHGEHFGWSNPNVRWDIVGDVSLAVNWATIGVGGVAESYATAAESYGEAVDGLTAVQDEAAKGLTAAATDGGMDPAGDATADDDAVPSAAADGNGIPPSLSGFSDQISELKALQAAKSGIAKPFNVTKKFLDVVGYGLGAAQTGYQIYSTASNWSKMSGPQQIESIANIFEATIPFFMEPMAQAIGDLANPDPTKPARVLATDSALLDNVPGRASSQAGEVDADLRAQIASWLGKNIDGEQGPLGTSAAGLVKLFTDGQGGKGNVFKAIYMLAGGKEADAADLDAFIVTGTDGKVRLIAVKEGAENPETLAHELLHAYGSPKFKSVGQSFVVDPKRAYSNLSEGAVDFLVSQLLGTDFEGSPEADIVGRIVAGMGDTAFYRAFFEGDASALSTFKALANAIPGIRVSRAGAPNNLEALAKPGAATKKLLWVLAHPDDETNSFLAVLKALNEGYEVHVLFVTRGDSGTQYEFSLKIFKPMSQTDLTGAELRNNPAFSATRMNEPEGVYAETGYGDKATVSHMGNPDFSPSDNPGVQSVDYAQIAHWDVPSIETAVSKLLKDNDYEAVVTMTMADVVHGAHQSITKITQDIIEKRFPGIISGQTYNNTADPADPYNGKIKPHLVMSFEVGWESPDNSPSDVIRYGLTKAELILKFRAVKSYEGQPPGFDDHFQYLRGYEGFIAGGIADGSKAAAKIWLDGFLQSPSTRTLTKGTSTDSPALDPLPVTLPHELPAGTKVAAGVLPHIYKKPGQTVPDLDAFLRDLSKPETHFGSDPALLWKRLYNPDDKDENVWSYHRNGGAQYVKPGLLGFRISGQKFVLFISSSKEPVDVFGSSGDGLKLTGPDAAKYNTLVWRSAKGAEAGAGQAIPDGSNGLHYVYRVQVSLDDLTEILSQKRDVKPNDVESVAVSFKPVEPDFDLDGTTARTSFKVALNPNAESAPRTGDIYSAPRVVGMPRWRKIGGAVTSVVLTAGPALTLAAVTGFHFGAMAAFFAVALPMFAVRAVGNLLIKIRQNRIDTNYENARAVWNPDVQFKLAEKWNDLNQASSPETRRIAYFAFKDALKGAQSYWKIDLDAAEADLRAKNIDLGAKQTALDAATDQKARKSARVALDGARAAVDKAQSAFDKATLRSNQIAIDIAIADGSPSQALTIDVSSARQDSAAAARALGKVETMTSGWQGAVLSGIPKSERQQYKALALIQKMNPKDSDLGDDGAFGQIRGVSANVYSPRGFPGRAWKIFQSLSFAPDFLNSLHGLFTTDWAAPRSLLHRQAEPGSAHRVVPYNAAEADANYAAGVANVLPTASFGVANADLDLATTSEAIGRAAPMPTSDTLADPNRAYTVPDPRIQPEGDTMGGVIRPSRSTPIRELVQGLGDREAVRHPGSRPDNTPLPKSQLKKWIPQVGWSLATASAPFIFLVHGAELAAGIATGNPVLIIHAAGKIVVTWIWMQGAREAAIDAARDRLGLPPNARQYTFPILKRYLDPLNAPIVGAEVYEDEPTLQNLRNPRLVKSWGLKGLPPAVVYGAGMTGYVILLMI